MVPLPFQCSVNKETWKYKHHWSSELHRRKHRHISRRKFEKWHAKAHRSYSKYTFFHTITKADSSHRITNSAQHQWTVREWWGGAEVRVGSYSILIVGELQARSFNTSNSTSKWNNFAESAGSLWLNCLGDSGGQKLEKYMSVGKEKSSGRGAAQRYLEYRFAWQVHKTSSYPDDVCWESLTRDAVKSPHVEYTERSRAITEWLLIRI